MKEFFRWMIRPGILLVPLFFCLPAHAQEKMKPGKIDPADLKLTHCSFDSAADAMILGDIGYTHFEYDDQHGFMMIFDRLLRIKIFTKNGFSRANFSITLYKDGSDEEKITTLKGHTYNLENGKILEDKLD
ncbi:MAG TPA: hypothetical protein VMC08_02595, partial [Bacteroidales bacterium]|nr:hypothetical protein [Bacteroidales bacterium]